VRGVSDPLARLVELPGVAEACASARAAVDRLLSHRVLRRRTSEVSAEAGLRCARASAALAGAEWDLADVRAGAVHGQPGAETVTAALRLSAELGPLTTVWERAPAQALARMHVLAAAGVAPEDRLGRPRAAGEPVADELSLPAAPSPDVVAARLAGLNQLLAAKTKAPAIVVAGIVHGELLALRPFGVGDGLVARAAARIVLVSRGLDPKAITAPDVGHLHDHDAYVGGARGYVDGDVGTWLVHCAEAVEHGAVEAMAVCAALERG
jgi:Fic family protein